MKGIAEARADLYDRLERGEISEQKAAIQEKILRGQENLKARIPLELMKLVTRTQNKRLSNYAAPLARELLGFVNGPDAIKQLGPAKDEDE